MRVDFSGPIGYKGGMNIVILGAGQTGSYVATVLSEEGHNVLLIDRDAKTLERVSREIDLAVLQAEAPNWKLFEEVLDTKPDLFFAATGHDETNLVCCSIAKNLGCPKTICRVHTLDALHTSQLDLERLFFVDHFISPEILTAQDLLKVLVYSTDVAVEHFAHGTIQMRTVVVPDLWDKGGTAIRDLFLPEDLIIGLIRRKMDEGEQILIPHGKDHILPGDEITVIGESKAIQRLSELFHLQEKKVQSVVLVGGSTVAAHLAQFLSQQKVSVRIIESDADRCEALADLLPHATIIHRDGSDPKLLRSEQIQYADALISCTHYDGTNLLIAALAKEIGCPKAIGLIREARYAHLLEKLHVIPALSAQINVANRILSILHEETILSVSSLVHDLVKIVELKVGPTAKIVGVPLSDLSHLLPMGILIAVIVSQGKVMIGRGNRVFCPNDTVIALCHPEHIPHLQQLFHR